MDAKVKRQLIGMMQTGHRHESMTDAAKCSHCGVKFQKAKSFLENVKQKEGQEFFRRKVEDVMSPERAERLNQYEHRLKNDPMYMHHLKKSFFGTESEKKREALRANSGYYTRHSDYQRKFWR